MNTILTNCNIYTMDEEKANAALLFSTGTELYMSEMMVMN